MKQLFSSTWLQTEQGCEPGEKGNTGSVSTVTWLSAQGTFHTGFRGVELIVMTIYAQAFICTDGSRYKKLTQYLLF